MTQTFRKVFDYGVAALVAIVLMNFAASSLGFSAAEAKDAGSEQIKPHAVMVFTSADLSR